MTQTSRILRSSALILSGALLLSACSGSDSSGEGDAPVNLTAVVVPGTVDGMLPVIANESGIMESNGISLEYVNVDNGPAAVTALSSASADAGHAPPAAAFAAYDTGAKIRWLSNNYRLDYTLLVRDNIDLPNLNSSYPDKIKDIKGLRVGVAGRGGVSELFATKALEDAGLSASDVTFIAVGTGTASVAAFENDQIDALVAIPPSQYLMQDEHQMLLTLEESEQVFGPDYLFNMQTASAEFAENPESVGAYCSALRETLDWANDANNQQELNGIIANHLNISETDAADLWKTFGGNFTLELTEAQWDAMSDHVDVELPSFDEAVVQSCAD